jgi:RNA polymerase sigma-70 factor (ECF subfamily)
MEEERRWLESAQRDPEAFRWFYDQYCHGIRCFLRGLVHDADLADELTARTFANALSSLEHYKWRGVPYGSYLHRIATNQAATYWRERASRQYFEPDAVAPLVDPSPDALAKLSGADQIERLREEIEKLSTAERTVLAMHYWEDLGVAEISEILDEPEGTIQSRLKRTRDKLADRFEEASRTIIPPLPNIHGAGPRNWPGWLSLPEQN